MKWQVVPIGARGSHGGPTRFPGMTPTESPSPNSDVWSEGTRQKNSPTKIEANLLQTAWERLGRKPTLLQGYKYLCS